MKHKLLVLNRDGKVTEKRHADLRYKHLKNILFVVIISTGELLITMFSGFCWLKDEALLYKLRNIKKGVTKECDSTSSPV
jgi:hypothetical protein